jgi:hypothetical protein
MARSVLAVAVVRGAAVAGAAITAAAVLGGCEAATTGPTIGVRNESDTVIKATFWTGQRDDSRVGGAKMRRAEEMNVGPRLRMRDSLTPLLHYRSAADTVVRVQLRPAETSFAPGSAREVWYELAPPSPYMVRVRRAPTGELVFEREGRGAMIPVPEAYWVREE